MIDSSKEYILCAALKRIEPKNTNSYWKNDLDTIEIGYRHHDIRNRFLGEVSCKIKDQGFYTSKGRFVNREEAMKIAYECGQVSSDVAIKNYTTNGDIIFGMLCSEDLY